MGIPDDPAALLDDARQSLLEAASHPDCSIRRRCAYHHAATQASDVIVRPESTAEQRDQAAHYLREALSPRVSEGRSRYCHSSTPRRFR